MAQYLAVAGAEDEDEGCVEFTQYGQLTREHRNPLIYNKGSAHSVHSDVHDSPTRPTAPSTYAEPTPMSASSMDPGSFLGNGIGLMPQAGMIKKDTMTSEAAMSNMSELNSSERIAKVNNVFMLPLFEITNTMHALMGSFNLVPKVLEEAVKDDTTTKGLLDHIARCPYKSRSMAPCQKQSFENLGKDLTPEQYCYFKQMYAFKTNYLFHALNMRGVYFQYVAVSREDMAFTNSEAFAARVKELMKQSQAFRKDPACKGNHTSLSRGLERKTLVLDLDETLIHASETMMANYDASFIYDDGNCCRTQVATVMSCARKPIVVH
ncbi:MAG: hypothetical protein P4M11_10475 [Candidatus Pacebacteria bacterium]|nr:hypothetical protein [Candidatus Paceibacterota bacterium]